MAAEMTGQNGDKKPNPRSLTAMEVAGWVLFVALFWSLSTYNIWVDYERRSIAVWTFRLITNEATSGVSALILVLMVRGWLDRFPLNGENLPFRLAMHGVGSVIFSLAHVGLMALMRTIVFWWYGETYVHSVPNRASGIAEVLLYEYVKDVPVYVAFLLIIVVYRIYRTRTATNIGTGAWATEPAAAIENTKILVRKGRADRPLALEDIDWFQAAANYVQIFSGGEEYLIRGTLTDMEKKLVQGTFVRVHRSYLVNVAKIQEVKPQQKGGHRVKLVGGEEIPVGRRYKENLYASIKA